jgi:cytochrome c oxidase subunit 1
VLGYTLQHSWVDALLNKRTCIGGVADGLVFIFVAGTWYLLTILIAGLKKFTWKILLELFYCLSLVSWAV